MGKNENKELLIKGFDFISEKKFYNAIEIFKQYISQNGKFKDKAYYGMGFVYNRLNKLLDAKYFFEKGLIINNQNVTLYIGLGDMYKRLGDYTKAVKIYKKGINLGRIDIQALLYRKIALVYFNYLKQVENSIYCYLRSIELDKNEVSSYICLIEIGLLEGEFELIDRMFKEINKIDISSLYKGFLCFFEIVELILREEKENIIARKEEEYNNKILNIDVNNEYDINEFINKLEIPLSMRKRIIRLADKIVFKPNYGFKKREYRAK